MHIIMIGAWQEKGVQQRYPSKKRSPKLIQFESPRWRPKITQVRIHLGIQSNTHRIIENNTRHIGGLFQTFFILKYMDGIKKKLYIFQWQRSNINDILNIKLTANDKTLQKINIKIGSLSSALKKQLSLNKMLETQISKLGVIVPIYEPRKIMGQPKL